MRKILTTTRLTVLTSILSLLFSFQKVSAADYYWIGGSGLWSDLTHWATTSGGTTNPIIVPTPVDNVYFDGNSFPAGGTLTLNFEGFCNTFNVLPSLGAGVTFQFNAGLIVSDFLNAVPNNLLTWNQTNKLECRNNVTFGKVNFLMNNGLFRITLGDLILQNTAYFKEQGNNNFTLDDGTVIMAAGTKFEMINGTFTAGNGNVSVPAGATFINTTNNKILKEGSFIAAAGSIVTVNGQWQIYDGGYDVDPGATYTKSGGHLYMYAEHPNGTYYIQNGGLDIHRIQFENNQTNVEYHLKSNLQAMSDGIFLYGNKFISNGYNIDCYHFYSWTSGVVGINLSGTATVTVRQQYRIYPGGTNLTYTAPALIKWIGTDHFYFWGGDKIHNDLLMEAANTGATQIFLQYVGQANNVTMNGNGQQYLEMFGNNNGTNAVFNNFTFNHNNAGVGANNPRLRLYNRNTFNGTFQTNSAGTNIRPILDLQANNTFNILDLNNLQEWVMNSGTVQTTADLQPIIGTCSRTVLIHSSSLGAQATLQQASGSVNMDWMVMQDMKAQGGATFTATNTINAGNNTGWTITGVPSQTFYWIGGSGNWNDAAHWSLSSGGPAGCAIPSRIDDVVYDANSFTGAQFCNINISTAECRSMTWTGTSAGAGISNNQTLNIYGNLVCASNMNWAHNGVFVFQNPTLATIRTNGVTINSQFQLIGQNQTTANWHLLDNLKSNQWVYLYYGKFKSNGFNLDVFSFYDQAVSSVTADFTGSTLIKLNYQWRMYTNSTLIMPATCEIVFQSANSHYFESHGPNNTTRKTYGNITFNNTNTGGTEIHLRGNYNNYNDVTVNHGGTYRFYNDGNFMTFNNLVVNYTQAVVTSNNNYVQIYSQNMNVLNNFTVTGQLKNNPRVEMPYNTTYNNAVLTNCYSFANWAGGAGNLRTFTNLTINSVCNAKTLIYSTSPGTRADIKVTGTASCDNCILQDINATGGGSFTSTNSAIAANVVGWPAGTGANYYWIGGTGNWNDPLHWSLTPGGPSAGCVPRRVDNVFFDINSFTAPNQTVTIQHDMECKNMVWNNVNNPIVNGSDIFHVFGSFVLASNMTWNHGNWVFFDSRNTGNTIKTNGVPLRYVQFLGENTYLGEWTLQSDFKADQYIYFRSGRFNTGGYGLEARHLWNDYNDNRITLDFTGTPEVKVHSQVHFYPNPTILASNTDFRFLQQQDGIFRFYNYGKTIKNVYVDFGASTGNMEFHQAAIYNNIIMNSTAWPSVYFYHGGTYNDISINYNNSTINIPRIEFSSTTTVNNLSVTSTGNGGPHLYLLQNNTFNNLTAAGFGTRLYIGANRTQTVNGLLALGNGSFPVIFQSTTSGTQGTIFKPTGLVCLDFVVMKDIKASTNLTGGATFYAGSSSVNLGNNTNWNFNSCGAYYWVGDNGNWSDYANHWATSSGGSSFHSSVPGPGDDVFFDANSFTTTNRVVTVDVPIAYAHDMKWNSASYVPTFTGTGTMIINGDLELITGMNQNYTGLWKFTAPDNGHFINTASQTLTNATFSGGTSGQGQWTLTNALNVANDLNFDNGTLLSNNKNITTKNFYSSTANNRTLQLGSSTLTINGGVWDPATLSNTGLVEGTSTIVITGDNTSSTSAFKGYGLTYNNVTFTTSTTLNSLMTGNNFFNTLRVNPGLTLNVEAAATNTMSSFIANASCVNLITIRSTVPGTQSNFSKTSGTVTATFLALRDMRGMGGATWNANYSYNNGNNTGWNFTPPLDITVTTSSTLVSCTLNNNGTASVTNISGGVPPYTYLWSTLETTSSIANLIPGTYTVTITDAVGCQSTKSIEVVNTPSPIVPAPFTMSASQVCLGTSITFTAGTTTPAATSYLWKFGDFTTSTSPNTSHNYTARGTYTVSLSYYDANGCPSTITSNVIISSPSQIITKTNVSCFGAGDGMITVTASGGIPPYQYSKDNGVNWQTSNIFSGLAPATYQIRTKDATNAAGCITSASAQTITQPSAALSQTLTSVNPTCDDGSITITALGGTPPYQYSINGGIGFSPSNSFQTLAAGNYSVVTRDANLCVTSAIQVTLTPGAGPEVNVTGNNVTILDGDNLPSITDHTDFGNVSLSSGFTRTFTIQNTGTLNLGVSSIVVSGPNASLFTVGSLTPAAPIPAGQSASFTVTFLTSTVGLKTATITITNTDCNEESYDFAIQGTGVTCTTPVFSECPLLQTANTAVTTCTAAVSYTVTATGTPAPTLTYSFSGATSGNGTGTGSGASFNKGITAVTITATNVCGTATCSFNVEVTDNVAPVLKTGSSIPSGGTNINACSAPAGPSEADIAALYEDNCGGAITVVKTIGSQTAAVCGWTVTYHYTIRDQSNNYATAVDISYSGSDKTAPVLKTGSVIPTGEAGMNACSAPTGPTEAAIAALYEDACGGAITVVKTVGAEIVAVCGWSVTYHYTIRDQCNNYATAVNISYSGSDQTAPSLTGTAYAGTTGTNACMANAATAAPFSATNAIQGYTDGCGGTVTAILTNTYVTGTNCGWTVTYTFTVKDACGIELTGRTYSNTGNDQTIPVITACPTNKSAAPNNASCTYKQVGTGWNATATDNCGTATVKYTLSGATTSAANAFTTLDNVVFNTGLTTVTAKAYDVCNNESAPCTFTVMVASTLAATCSNTNPSMYFGYPGDQSATIKAKATGGVGPYTISITMNRPLNCNVITSSGDELWTAASGTSVNNVCPSSGPGLIPVSTGTGIASGVDYTVNVTLMQDAIFTATITDANGCITTCTTSVHAEDARCFAGNSGISKVTICHRTGSNSNPCVKICVDQSAVNTHLTEHGDFVGNCTPNCVAPVYGRGVVIEAEPQPTDVFNVKVIPNPTDYYFTLDVESGSNEKIVVVVYDNLGRIVKRIERSDRQLISFGEEFKAGTYMAEVIQGANRKVVKLLKLY